MALPLRDVRTIGPRQSTRFPEVVLPDQSGAPVASPRRAARPACSRRVLPERRLVTALQDAARLPAALERLHLNVEIHLASGFRVRAGGR